MKGPTPVFMTPRVMFMNSSIWKQTKMTSYMRNYYPMHLVFNLDFNVEPGMDSVQIEHYPFDDAQQGVCAFEELDKLCSSADAHLRMDADNYCCFYGSSETKISLMVCAYLLYSGACFTAFEAIDDFHKKCIQQNVKIPNTSPSYLRYLLYYEKALHSSRVKRHALQVDNVRLVTVPNYAPSLLESGCNPHIKVDVLLRKADEVDVYRSGTGALSSEHGFEAVNIFSSMPTPPEYPPEYYDREGYLLEGYEQYEQPVAPFVDTSQDNLVIPVGCLTNGDEVNAEGDMRLQLFNNDELVGQVWFNTCFVEKNYLVFDKDAIDLICNDANHYLFSPEFKLEIFLHRDASVQGHFGTGGTSPDRMNRLGSVPGSGGHYDTRPIAKAKRASTAAADTASMVSMGSGFTSTEPGSVAERGAKSGAMGKQDQQQKLPPPMPLDGEVRRYSIVAGVDVSVTQNPFGGVAAASSIDSTNKSGLRNSRPPSKPPSVAGSVHSHRSHQSLRSQRSQRTTVAFAAEMGTRVGDRDADGQGQCEAVSERRREEPGNGPHVDTLAAQRSFHEQLAGHADDSSE